MGHGAKDRTEKHKRRIRNERQMQKLYLSFVIIIDIRCHKIDMDVFYWQKEMERGKTKINRTIGGRIMKEWNENKLDQELEAMLEDMPQQEELEKKIEQRMKKKIQKIVCRTLIGIVGAILVLLLIINPFLNSIFINPAKLNEGEHSQMQTTLKNYWETTQPYVELVTLKVKKKGFARYELAMQITDRRSPVIYGVPNVWVDMKFGKYVNWRDSGLVTSFWANRFENPYEEKEEYLEKIKELPESSILYLSIGTESPKVVEELRKESVDVQWVEVYQPNSAFQGGLALRDSLIGGDDIARTDMTEAQLKETYLSHLKDLLDHMDIWNSLDLQSSKYVFSGQGKESALRECYEDAKQLDVLKAKNYCISGKRDEIVEYLEKTDISSILVDEVKLSELSN